MSLVQCGPIRPKFSQRAYGAAIGRPPRVKSVNWSMGQRNRGFLVEDRPPHLASSAKHVLTVQTPRSGVFSKGVIIHLESPIFFKGFYMEELSRHAVRRGDAVALF